MKSVAEVECELRSDRRTIVREWVGVLPPFATISLKKKKELCHRLHQPEMVGDRMARFLLKKRVCEWILSPSLTRYY